MGECKHPGRFTIQFNMADPQQREAAELLSQQGRRKAQFLTGAILHHQTMPQQAAVGGVDMDSLRAMVRQVLQEEARPTSDYGSGSGQVPQGRTPQRAEEAGPFDDALTALTNTLAAFQA